MVGVLLVGAVGAAVSGASRASSTARRAFVERYLDLLAEGRAAEALAMPGVAVDSAELEAAGLPGDGIRRRSCGATRWRR